MKIKVFVQYFFAASVLYFSILAMPVLDVGMPMPGATATTSPVVPTPTAVALPGVSTVPTAAVAAQAVPGAVSTGLPLPLQFANETELLSALREAASPATPLLGTATRTKVKIYDVIIKSAIALSTTITYKTKKDAFWGFITDVIYQILDSNQVTMQMLSDMVTSLNNIKTDCDKVKTELQKSKSPDASELIKTFTDVADTVDRSKKKLDDKIKRQNDFIKLLETARKIENEKFDAKLDAYKKLVIAVDRTIISSSRQDLFTDLGRLLNAAVDDAARQKVFKLFDLVKANIYFTADEKNQLESFKKLKFGEVAAPVVAKPVEVAAAAPVAAPQAAAPVAVKAVAAPVAVKVAAPVATVNVDDIKKQLNAAGKDYAALINACNVAIDALPKVVDVAAKRTLISAISEKLVLLYNNRNALKDDILPKLISLFEKAAGNPLFVKLITPQRVNSIKLIPSLNAASSEQNTSKKIAAYMQLANTITKDIDNFERGRFIDGVTNLFGQRKKMEPAEIDALKNLLNFLNSDAFKNKKVFDSTTQRLIGDWIKTIQAASVLSTSTDSKSIKDQVTQLKSIIDSVALPNSEKERKAFFVSITNLFNSRGNATKEELTLIKNFFTEIQNKPGMLAPDQVRVMVAWLNELDYAVSATNGTKSYLECVLDAAAVTKDLNVYKKVLQLFTPQTSSANRVTFVSGLNTMFSNRKNYDKTAMIAFFKAVDQRKVSPSAYLLGPSQKAVLTKWIKALEDEVKGVAPKGLK